MRHALLTTGFCLMLMVSCTSYNSANDAQRIDTAVTATLYQLLTDYPAAQRLAENAEGVLVIPRMSQGGFIVGGGYGRGALRIDNETQAYYSAAKGSFGLQAGSQQFSYVLFFMTESALEDFFGSSGWTAGGSVQYVISDRGDGWGADIATSRSPIIAISFNQSGLGAGATLEGMKFSRIHPE